MAYPEKQYHRQETAKEYTKQYNLEGIDSIITRQEDGLLGYISAGEFATTGSNTFTGNQIINADLTIDGDIYANQFLVTTSSVTHYTASTNFGLDGGDTHTFTGSVRVTGSLNVLGNATLTGSFLVSGSTTQIGNNTLIGNTVLSGSIEVSGSFTGSLQIDGDINLSSPHNFYRWGNRLFNYANYYNTGSIVLTSGSATTLTYTSDTENGFTLVSGSRIYANYTGYYNIQFSVQMQKPGAQPAEVDVWLSKGGQNIPYTDSSFTLPFKSNIIGAVNFFVPMSAGEYVELKATTNDSSVGMVTLPSNSIKPASPSIVVTVLQIS